LRQLLPPRPARLGRRGKGRAYGTWARAAARAAADLRGEVSFDRAVRALL